MSFRRAHDSTNIAQLVGRMIRLLLWLEGSVKMKFSTQSNYSCLTMTQKPWKQYLRRLRNPEAEEGVPTRVETSAEDYPRNPNCGPIFDLLRGLPNYSINRAPKMCDLKRALRLGGMLVHEGLDEDADDEMRDALTARLKELRDFHA